MDGSGTGSSPNDGGSSKSQPPPAGILRVDVGRPRRPSLDIRYLGLIEPGSPQPSVDRLSVTFADESLRSERTDTSPRMADKVLLPTPTDEDLSEDDDYSASVTAIMQRRASTRRSKKKSGRRGSSPFSPDILPDMENGRRRSSVFTTSSGDTAITMEDSFAPSIINQEQIYENIKLHKEVLGSVKMQPWNMKKKLKLVTTAKAYIKKHEGALQERLTHSRSIKDITARFNIFMNSVWQQFKREFANFSNWLIPWELRIKEIESHFGSVVASYFIFLRWLFSVNIVIAIVLVCFVTIPEMLIVDDSVDRARKSILPEDRHNATNFLTLWDFEGFFKYSPMFYGWYTDKEIKGNPYKLPLAYFFTGLAVYVYSFIATLRRMAKNSRMSKLSEKEDECVFSWKVFTGWDFMIGNAETADNRVASIVMGFKEALLEEAEKKREAKSWKLIAARILVNTGVFSLLALSAFAVFKLVERSNEAQAKTGSTWRRNELSVVMTLISNIFPIFFELLGYFEHYHPRKQLRLQLARIMVLNLLNLYSLTFSLFGNIDKMTTKLQSFKPNATMETITTAIDSCYELCGDLAANATTRTLVEQHKRVGRSAENGSLVLPVSFEDIFSGIDFGPIQQKITDVIQDMVDETQWNTVTEPTVTMSTLEEVTSTEVPMTTACVVRCLPVATTTAVASNRTSYKSRSALRSLCWETMFGQELVKLTVMDLVMTVLSTLAIDFLRGLFVRHVNDYWCWDLERGFPQYGDFKVAENILHLVNNQGMVWMGMFFSPGLVTLNVFKLLIMMYLRSWAVLTCNVPHEIIFKASRSNNFYFALLLMMLFLCVLPVGYTIVWIEPSWHCGPFSTYGRIFHVFTKTIRAALPSTFHNILDYMASPGIVIPLLVLLILIIYYLISLTGALREANNDLKIQLRRERTEERRKMFQIADKRRRAGSTSSADINNPFGKWKKLLQGMPSNKSFDESAENTPAEEKPEVAKKAFSRFVFKALKKPPEYQQDDATDTDQHESLPDDIASPKKSKKVESSESKKVKIRDKREAFSKKDSFNSSWSDNIPVITISKTESSECIVEGEVQKNENEEDFYKPRIVGATPKDARKEKAEKFRISRGVSKTLDVPVDDTVSLPDTEIMSAQIKEAEDKKKRAKAKLLQHLLKEKHKTPVDDIKVKKTPKEAEIKLQQRTEDNIEDKAEDKAKRKAEHKAEDGAEQATVQKKKLVTDDVRKKVKANILQYAQKKAKLEEEIHKESKEKLTEEIERQEDDLKQRKRRTKVEKAEVHAENVENLEEETSPRKAPNLKDAQSTEEAAVSIKAAEATTIIEDAAKTKEMEISETPIAALETSSEAKHQKDEEKPRESIENGEKGEREKEIERERENEEDAGAAKTKQDYPPKPLKRESTKTKEEMAVILKEVDEYLAKESGGAKKEELPAFPKSEGIEKSPTSYPGSKFSQELSSASSKYSTYPTSKSAKPKLSQQSSMASIYSLPKYSADDDDSAEDEAFLKHPPEASFKSRECKGDERRKFFSKASKDVDSIFAKNVDVKSTKEFAAKSTKEFDAKSTKVFDARSSNIFEEKSSTAFDAKSTKEFGAKSTKVFAARSSNIFEEKSSTAFDAKSTKDFGAKSSNVFEEKSSTAFDAKSTKDVGAKSSNVFEEKSSNAFGATSSNVFEGKSANAFDAKSSKVFEEKSTNSCDSKDFKSEPSRVLDSETSKNIDEATSTKFSGKEDSKTEPSKIKSESSYIFRPSKLSEDEIPKVHGFKIKAQTFDDSSQIKKSTLKVPKISFGRKKKRASSLAYNRNKEQVYSNLLDLTATIVTSEDAQMRREIEGRKGQGMEEDLRKNREEMEMLGEIKEEAKGEKRKEDKAKEEKRKEDKAKEEKLKEDKAKEEKFREEKLAEETRKKDKAKEEKRKEDKAKETKPREDTAKEERLKEDKIIEEKSKEDKVAEEMRKEENVKEEKLREEKVAEERRKKGKAKEAKLREDKEKEETRKKCKVNEEERREDKEKEETRNKSNINEEEPRDEDNVKEETLREDKVKEEKLREVNAKEEKRREDKAKEEKLREDNLKEEKLREDNSKEEKLREDKDKEEKLTGDKVKEEKRKEDKAKEETRKKYKVKEEERREDGKVAEEKRKKDKVKEEWLREDKIKEEWLREDNVKEEKLREDKAKEEMHKKYKVKEEERRENKVAEEKSKKDKVKEEWLREDNVREETLRESKAKDEKLREYKAKEEKRREVKAKEEKRKEDNAKEEKLTEDQVKEEKRKEDKANEGTCKKYKVKEEERREDDKVAEEKRKKDKVKEEWPKEDKIKEEWLKESKVKEDWLKESKIKEENGSEERKKRRKGIKSRLKRRNAICGASMNDNEEENCYKMSIEDSFDETLLEDEKIKETRSEDNKGETNLREVEEEETKKITITEESPQNEEFKDAQIKEESSDNQKKKKKGKETKVKTLENLAKTFSREKLGFFKKIEKKLKRSKDRSGASTSAQSKDGKEEQEKHGEEDNSKIMKFTSSDSPEIIFKFPGDAKNDADKSHACKTEGKGREEGRVGKEEERKGREEEQGRKKEERGRMEEERGRMELERGRKEEQREVREEERGRKREERKGKEEERGRNKEERGRYKEERERKEEERKLKEEERRGMAEETKKKWSKEDEKKFKEEKAGKKVEAKKKAKALKKEKAARKEEVAKKEEAERKEKEERKDEAGRKNIGEAHQIENTQRHEEESVHSVEMAKKAIDEESEEENEEDVRRIRLKNKFLQLSEWSSVDTAGSQITLDKTESSEDYKDETLST